MVRSDGLANDVLVHVDVLHEWARVELWVMAMAMACTPCCSDWMDAVMMLMIGQVLHEPEPGPEPPAFAYVSKYGYHLLP